LVKKEEKGSRIGRQRRAPTINELIRRIWLLCCSCSTNLEKFLLGRIGKSQGRNVMGLINRMEGMGLYSSYCWGGISIASR
jgi:hypothetical protein